MWHPPSDGTESAASRSTAPELRPSNINDESVKTPYRFDSWDLPELSTFSASFRSTEFVVDAPVQPAGQAPADADPARPPVEMIVRARRAGSGVG